MATKAQLAIAVTPADRDRLWRLARASGQSVSMWVREAISARLHAEEHATLDALAGYPRRSAFMPKASATRGIVVDGGQVRMQRPRRGALGEWRIDDCAVLHDPAANALRAARCAGNPIGVIFWHDGAQYTGRAFVAVAPEWPALLGFYLRGTGAPERQR